MLRTKCDIEHWPQLSVREWVVGMNKESPRELGAGKKGKRVDTNIESCTRIPSLLRHTHRLTLSVVGAVPSLYFPAFLPTFLLGSSKGADPG